MRVAEPIAIVLTVLALAPAALAASDPWEAAAEAREALGGAEIELVLGSPETAEAALATAERATTRLLDGHPAELATAEAALRAASDAVARGDERAFAIARVEVWTTILRASYVEATRAAARGDAAAARSWLLVREFRPPTRFSRASVDATLAVERLRAGKLAPAAAAKAVRIDLLDTYDGRLRSTLDAVRTANASGFDVRRAATAAAAAGYWRIVRPTFVAQRGAQPARSADVAFARLVADAAAGREPTTLGRIEQALEGFRAAPLAEAEQLRRAGQLLRFVELVPIEYGRGVEDGRVVLDFELQEATTFRDGAAAAFADLESILLGLDPRSTRAIGRSLDELGTALDEATRGERVAAPEAIEATADAVLARAETVFPKRWREAAEAADFDVISATLDRMQAAAGAGEWGRAEQARLEAYGVFELGPEQRLRGIAPGTFQRVETLFWYGDGEVDGLVQLLKRKSTAAELEQTRLVLDEALGEAEARVGAGAGSRASVITNSAIIVFREGLEAVLILAALMASLVGARRKLRRPLLLGVGAALVASAATWVVAQTVLGSLAGWGEKLEAVVSLVAIGVLLLILNWFYHRVYWQENLQDLHRKKKRILAGASVGILSAQTIGLLALGFSSVYREGFETVLFLQAMTLEAGAFTVLEGVVVGFAGVLAVFGLVIALERRLPHKKMLIATGVLITAVLVVLVGQTVQTTQVVGWVPVTPVEGLTLPYWAGTWFGLFPTWEGLAAQAAAAVFVVGSYLAAEALRRRKRSRISFPTPVPPALPANFPGEMGELRFEELLPRKRNGLGRAGHRDEHAAPVGAGGGARQHRG